MTKQDIFALACDLAAEYHEGQQYHEDGNGYYLDHLLPVATSATRFAQPWLHPLDVQTVGVLHDILEDTECTADVLLDKGIPAYLVEAVILLTKSSTTNRRDYITNLMLNPLSHCVKIADSHFNLTQSLIERNYRRVKKYTENLTWMMIQ